MLEKRRRFIINFLYFAILFALAAGLLKFGLPLLSPFILAFLIAYLLKRPVRFLARRTGLPHKAAAILLVFLFYATIGLFLAALSFKAFSAAGELPAKLPQIFRVYAEPVLTAVFQELEHAVARMDPTMLDALEYLWEQSTQSLGQFVSGLSMRSMAVLSGIASSLPALFIKLLFMVISTFFIAADYDRLTGFCLRQLSGRGREIFLQVKSYIVGTLFVCIRSYALIMSITFVELAAGLTLIGVEHSLLIALGIAIFDILPVLGTGGVMLPWAALTALQGEYGMALKLAAVYLVITVIRNILEPKIVGSQIGLHPVVTLASMFVGAQLLGILGLFGFPIGISLLRHLNDTGTIHIFRKVRPPREEKNTVSG